jgi:hypothetical protein
MLLLPAITKRRKQIVKSKPTAFFKKTRAKTQYKIVQNRSKFHITSGSRLSKLAPQERIFLWGINCNMWYECRLFTPDPQSRFQAVEVNKDRGWSHGAILRAKLPATASSLVDVGIIMDQRRRHGCSRHNAHNGPDLTTSAENSCAKTRDATWRIVPAWKAKNPLSLFCWVAWYMR